MLAFLVLGYGFLLPLVSAAALCRVMRRRLGWLKSKERKAGKEKIHRLFPRPRRPLSGGLAILLSFTLGLAALNLLVNHPPQSLAWPLLALVWVFGLIGFADDLRKVGGRGLAEREKLVLQAAAGLAFALLLQHRWGFGIIRVPFSDSPLALGYLYPVLGMLVIVAISNAVNLTDGIDGLAGGQVAIAAFFLLGMCGLLGKPLAAEVFLPLLAACLGFLIFNYPPARLLMGDMGSLALGAALGGGAMLAGLELFLPVAGAVFVINALSVIIQIGTVRWVWRVVRFPRQRTTEPFRLFLCTPLHHHFQWLGWPEKAVLRLFWGMGIGFGGLALAGMFWGGAWVLGIALLPLPLLAAAVQKLSRGSYFIGLAPAAGDVSRLALFQGLPVEALGRKLYGLVRRTSLSESVLPPGSAEGLLWRPMTEIEARVALGSLFLQQHLADEALSEWEEIPMRNLLLRESVVLQLARLYYSRERLLEAIRLWEALPRTRLAAMPNLQEIIRAARLRLAELASKSYRQCAAAFSLARAGQRTDLADLRRQLLLSRGFNQDLLTLVGASPRGASRQAERTVQRRIKALERALEWCEKQLAVVSCQLSETETRNAPEAHLNDLTPETSKMNFQLSTLNSQLLDFLGFRASEIEQAIAATRHSPVEIVSFEASAKASRNAIAQLGLRGAAGHEEVVAKAYRKERVAFFSASYRREKALLEMLSGYGCPVPGVRGDILKADRALLVMEDGGRETLAERLEGVEAAGRESLLTAAVAALALLHRQAAQHFAELKEEVRKVDKEVLSAGYHLNAFRIALERLTGIFPGGKERLNLEEIQRRYEPAASLLAARPESFIHFEFTPQHLLFEQSRLTIFDFEQGTIGPAEFDVACLLDSPEADPSAEARASLVESYEKAAETRLEAVALDYASLAKCLTHAGAALNFYQKFGGHYHLQRLDWYLAQCLSLLARQAGLASLRQALSPWLEKAQERGRDLSGGGRGG